jgi:arsenate reductase
VSLLEENGVEFTKIEYLKTPLNKDEILSLSKKLGLPPSGFVRKNESDFKDNKLGKLLNDHEALAEAIEKYPKIMERPMAVLGEKAVIGRPPEKVLTLLE